MKKINEVFKRLKKEWVSTEICMFDDWHDAFAYERELDELIKNGKKIKYIGLTHERPDGTEYMTVEVFEKKRLAH